MDLRQCLPPTSLLHHWLDAQSILETPISYDLVCGCALIGSVLRRDVWYDQVHFNVWPNTSVLLVGPSGSGKDTAINAAVKVLRPIGRIPIINGITMEEITAQLVKQGHTAAGLMTAKEMSVLFGPKDYQAGIITGLTDLMSGGDVVEVALRSAPDRKIHRPTLTFMAGSTVHWLHEFMPKHTNEGGFYPRILITVEHGPKRKVPLVDKLPQEEVQFALQHLEEFRAGMATIIHKYSTFGRMEFKGERAWHMYEDWYNKRHTMFSPLADAYAHRSRDNCLRLCMISAVSRLAEGIEPEDVHFATTVMKFVGSRIDAIFAPPTDESKMQELIIKMLPAPKDRIYMELVKTYKPRDIGAIFNFLLEHHQISERGGVVVKGV